MRLFAAVPFLLLAATAGAASAVETAPPQHPSALCLAGVAAAEQTHGTPPGLLATIAKVESGRAGPGGGLAPWPWTIDADGRSLFFQTKDEAVAWVKGPEGQRAKYVDVGCMQIDLPMHPGAFRSVEEAFDPAANTAYAGRFLRDLHDGPAGGNWYVATGMYHSRTPDLAATYREAVAAVAAGRPIPAVGAGTTRLQFLRLALAGGGQIRINLARQPGRVKRKMSACEIAGVLGPYLRSPPKGCGKTVAAAPRSVRLADAVE